MDKFFACCAARMAALAAAGFIASLGLPTSAAVENPAATAPPEVVAREFVVELRGDHNVQLKDIESLSQHLGVQVVDRVRSNMVLVRSSTAADAATLEIKLREHPLVSRVEPNYVYHANNLNMLKTPNDPDFVRTWGLQNTGAADTSGTIGLEGVDISAKKAWDISTGSKSVVVAVIDSGVDFAHPDLKTQAWVNEKELNGKAGVDDDGNGLIDDINGCNFVGDNGNSTDDNGHGSHCSGTIGANGGDKKGLVGVNWSVSIMAVKFLDEKGGGTLANAIKAVDYARMNGAQIMSNSWGGRSLSALLQTAIEDANKVGTLFVVAAGNDTNDNDVNPTYPANYPVENILSVAAVNNRGILAPFSNYGTKTVHVAAPGVNIVSSVLNGGYDSYSGTSMATPHVAGIAALLLANNPSWKASELKGRILSSARPLSTLKKQVSTGGMADAYYALSGLTPPEDPNDPAKLSKVIPYAFSTDHPYKGAVKLERTIKINGAKKIAVRFSRFETEIGYDTVTIFDSNGEYISSMSGILEPGVVSPLVEGDTIVLKYSSDETIDGYGFDVEAVLSE